MICYECQAEDEIEVERKTTLEGTNERVTKSPVAVAHGPINEEEATIEIQNVMKNVENTIRDAKVPFYLFLEQKFCQSWKSPKQILI